MSYKDGYAKELGITAPEPAGSLAPLNSTQDGSKWSHGVNSASLAKLAKIATEINECFEKAVRSHVKMQIDIGRLLNDARTDIPGDRQFGQWREQNTPISNKSTANKLMNLAKQVGEGRITQDMLAKLPLSNLKELLAAPDSVLGEVEARLESGEQPSRDEIRELAREARGGDASGSADDAAPEGADRHDDQRAPEVDSAPEKAHEEAPSPALSTPQTKGPTTPASPPRVTPASQIPKILAMTLIERIRYLDPDKVPYDSCKLEEWAWLVLGLDPNPGYFPSLHIVEVLGLEWASVIENSGAHDVDRLMYTLQKAEKITHELIESDNDM